MQPAFLVGSVVVPTTNEVDLVLAFVAFEAEIAILDIENSTEMIYFVPWSFRVSSFEEIIFRFELIYSI